MNFNSVRIVLVSTSHPGNIGSTARALKTMGFKRLTLVTPKFFPDKKAITMAAGAEDILENCIISTSLSEALKDCQLVIATSARNRALTLPELTPAECATVVASQPDNTEVAIVFGSEYAGLTNEELLACHFHVIIPANPEYSSLNLSHSVQILVYELRQVFLLQTDKVPVPNSLATVEEVEQLYVHWLNLMSRVNFFKPANPGKMKERLKRLLNRSRLEKIEINILRGFLKAIENQLSVKNLE